MIRRPWRSKLAAVVILFVLGTFAAQIRQVLDTVRGGVERGARITDEIRSTVTTIQQVDTRALEAQIADLQAKLAAGTATPEQVRALQALLRRVQARPGPSGPPGPPGPSGSSPGPTATTGPPPGPTPSPTTTTTARPGPTTTTSRLTPTTTTTRCAVRIGRLLKAGCQ